MQAAPAAPALARNGLQCRQSFYRGTPRSSATARARDRLAALCAPSSGQVVGLADCRPGLPGVRAPVQCRQGAGRRCQWPGLAVTSKGHTRTAPAPRLGESLLKSSGSSGPGITTSPPGPRVRRGLISHFRREYRLTAEPSLAEWALPMLVITTHSVQRSGRSRSMFTEPAHALSAPRRGCSAPARSMGGRQLPLMILRPRAGQHRPKVVPGQPATVSGWWIFCRAEPVTARRGWPGTRPPRGRPAAGRPPGWSSRPRPAVPAGKLLELAPLPPGRPAPAKPCASTEGRCGHRSDRPTRGTKQMADCQAAASVQTGPSSLQRLALPRPIGAPRGFRVSPAASPFGRFSGVSGMIMPCPQGRSSRLRPLGAPSPSLS